MTMHDTILTRAAAISYCLAVIDHDDPYPCEHGHHGCAASPSGPCLDETMGKWELTEDEV